MSNIARNKPIKKVLIFAAVVEAVTGLTMLIAPSLVGQLLLGDKLAGAAILVARVTGIALIGLGGGLLARPASSRHVCVQRSRHSVSFLRWFRGGVDWRSSVARGCSSPAVNFSWSRLVYQRNQIKSQPNRAIRTSAWLTE